MLKANFHKHILQFKRPAGTSRGVMLEKPVWYLAVWDDTRPEIRGIGECSPLTGLSCDDRPGYEAMLHWAVSRIHLPAEILYGELQRWPSIRFGVEMALRDLSMGGKRILFPSAFTSGEEVLSINGLVWMGDMDFMLREVEDRLSQGFRVIKMKVGAIDFQKECDILSGLRDRFDGDRIEIRLDANGAFPVDKAADKLDYLSQFSIHSIEQPIRAGQHEDMAELCRKSPIPIALDEELIGIHDYRSKEELLRHIHPHYIILKPSLIGGFTGSLEWINLAGSLDIGWWVTSALESNIGLNAIAQWTATLGNHMPQGLGTGSLYTNNIPSPLKVEGATLHFIPSHDWDLKNTGSETIASLDAEPSLVLNGRQLSGKELKHVADKMSSSGSVPAWEQDLGRFLVQWLSDPETITVQTSGSTGSPKPIQIAKRAMVASALATDVALQASHCPDALLCLSPNYIAGMMMVVRAMTYGQNLVTVKPDGHPFRNLAEGVEPGFAAMVPAQVFNSLQDDHFRERFMKIRKLIIGGGEIAHALEELLKDYPGEIYATYGMTETITHIALRRINGSASEEYFSTLTGVTVDLDERGCLIIKASHISKDPIVTNDLAELADEQHFRWLGRYDHVINRGGQKIIPEQMEKILAPFISQRFYLVGQPDDKFGRVPVLFIESDPWPDFQMSGLQTAIHELLPHYARPVRIYFRSRFEETTSGKVKRLLLI